MPSEHILQYFLSFVVILPVCFLFVYCLLIYSFKKDLVFCFILKVFIHHNQKQKSILLNVFCIKIVRGFKINDCLKPNNYIKV